MTVHLRDLSHWDKNTSLSGYVGATHKLTEGTRYDKDYRQLAADRLTAWRRDGATVLGTYHVVRTPGDDNHGSLMEQWKYWLSNLDSLVPWWRTHPHWLMQIDGERWSYDVVSSRTILDFAALVKSECPHGLIVTYASRGQYGDLLRGIATPLWNADYRGSENGYQGDDWTSTGKQAAGWAQYSGQTPLFVQWRSTPYDTSAYRGSLADLKALIAGGDVTFDEWKNGLVAESKPAGMGGPDNAIRMADYVGYTAHTLASLSAAVKALGDQVTALTAEVAALKGGMMPGQVSGDVSVSGTLHVG